ncbi:MAG: hypothetical protein HDT07_01725 [Bacteroidales bacterium]|nr:hypothetical protein [Bacteroidales bacterium]
MKTGHEYCIKPVVTGRQLLQAIVSHYLDEPTAIASFESDMMVPTETSGEAATISFYV